MVIIVVYECCHYMTCFHNRLINFITVITLLRFACMTITQIVIAKLFMVSKIQVTTLPQLETPLMCLWSCYNLLFIRLA